MTASSFIPAHLPKQYTVGSRVWAAAALLACLLLTGCPDDSNKDKQQAATPAAAQPTESASRTGIAKETSPQKPESAHSAAAEATTAHQDANTAVGDATVAARESTGSAAEVAQAKIGSPAAQANGVIATGVLHLPDGGIAPSALDDPRLRAMAGSTPILAPAPAPALYASSADAYEVLRYAVLSQSIYDHGDDCGTATVTVNSPHRLNGEEKWIRFDEQRDRETEGEFKLRCEIQLARDNGLSVQSSESSGQKPWGFHAEAYFCDSYDAIIVVYEGTKLTDVADLAADVRLVSGHPRQYELALRFAEHVVKSPKAKGRIVEVCGHSLGGALAQYVALSRNLKAYTFNASGLSAPSWKSVVPGKMDPPATHIESIGTSGARELISMVGAKISGEVLCVDVGGAQPLRLHSIDSLVSALTGLNDEFLKFAKLTVSQDDVESPGKILKSMDAKAVDASDTATFIKKK